MPASPLRLAPTRHPLVATLLLAVTCLVACTGSTEDVRITLCKNLVTALAFAGSPPTWLDISHQQGRFRDLVITLEYAAGDDPEPRMVASCRYEKESLPEENVIHDVNPLTTYRTRPSDMILNGEVVPSEQLDQAIRQNLLNQGKETLEKVEAGAAKAMDAVQQRLE